MHQKYNMKPKEPDKYTTFKIALRNILLDPKHQQTIFTTVESYLRTSKSTHHPPLSHVASMGLNPV